MCDKTVIVEYQIEGGKWQRWGGFVKMGGKTYPVADYDPETHTITIVPNWQWRLMGLWRRVRSVFLRKWRIR